MEKADIPIRETLTVEQAAVVLGISRGVAYNMAHDYVTSDGKKGLPVLRLGKRLVVPRARLDRLLEGIEN